MGKPRRIPTAEKLLILADAIETDAPRAAERWGVTAAAVWKWAEELGGLVALRELYEARRLSAVADMATSVARQVHARAGSLGERSVVALAQSIIQASQEKGGGSVVVNAPQAIAGVQQVASPARMAEILAALRDCGALDVPAAPVLPPGNGSQPDGH